MTGGAGYIGSIVAEQLIQSGCRVVVYDDLSHGHLEAIPAEAEFVHASLADEAALNQVFAGGIDAVMHFSGFIEAGESMKVPEAFFRNNTANSLTLLEAMLAHRVQRLLFSSTAAVYGEPEQVPIPEDHPLRPTNAYGESKLMVEQMLGWFNRAHGLGYCCLRYFNAAGATETRGEAHEPESHLIPLVLQVAMGKRKSISIFGTDYPTADGSCVRDYIHVSDLASAHVLAVRALGPGDQLIYNVGTGTGASVRDVVEAAREVTGHPIPAVEEPRRAGDPAVLVASSDKLRKELGWRPKYPGLEQIVRSAWEWHRKQAAMHAVVGDRVLQPASAGQGKEPEAAFEPA